LRLTALGLALTVLRTLALLRAALRVAAALRL
jgi:hypothetical protein